MCHTGSPLVSNWVAGEAEQRPVVVSGASLVAHSLHLSGEAPVGLPGDWELDKLLENWFQLFNLDYFPDLLQRWANKENTFLLNFSPEQRTEGCNSQIQWDLFKCSDEVQLSFEI